MKGLCLVVFVACSARVAWAEPPFLKVVLANYGVGTCQTCHTSPPTHNVFGQAVEGQLKDRGLPRVNEDILVSLESQDTDGDGFSNGDELRSGTSPGDPKSFPVAKVPSTPPANPSIVPSHAFHPLVVHFPIALFLFGAFLDVLGARRKDSGLRQFAMWNLGFGAVASVAAIATGFAAFLMLQLPWSGIALIHMVLGASACVFMLGSAAIKRSGRDESAAYWVVLALASILTTVAGHFGATLVFG